MTDSQYLDIFIPYWGDESFLFEAVESVLNQDDDRWRLTVIDDCYPSDMVAPYFARIVDPRVTYRRNDKNVGITENFRRSIAGATASHVTVLGSDDRLKPNYVRTVLSAIDAFPNADVIETGIDVIDAAGERSMPLVDRVKQSILAPRSEGRHKLVGQAMANSLIRGNWLYWPSLALRVETARRIDFRDELLVIQDLALLMDVAFDGGMLVYDTSVAFEYRRHNESASQATLLNGTRLMQEREYFALAADLARGVGYEKTARIARARWFSRAHAVTLLPTVLLRGTRAGRRAVWAHILKY
ncbi:glycosyltransferase [Microbacterium sp. YY-03]|uniref:glycosyltransferase n=1 Tax=Microbacterium sp. YY-03 TaxID=3421636 RepID=UPI003D176030